VPHFITVGYRATRLFSEISRPAQHRLLGSILAALVCVVVLPTTAALCCRPPLG
jgi:hypothetical protein